MLLCELCVACTARRGFLQAGLKRMFWTLPSEVPLTRMGIPVEYGETQSNTHPTTATTAGNVALK